MRWLARRPAPPVLSGSRAHDAAVLRALRGRPVVCADQTVEGVHFAPDAAPAAVGQKAAGRALSDLAATAARPHALVLGISAPETTEEHWLRRAISAVDRTARAHGAALVGGDLACAPGRRVLSVSALGQFASRRRPPGRDRARPGQLVLLTGPVGGSSLGRHLCPRPRLAQGSWLHAHGATALIDVSDGLARDLERVARASGVRIDLDEIPVHAHARRLARHSGRSAREHALGDGEDHELLATLAPAAWGRLAARARARFPGLCAVGRVRRGRGLWIAGEDGAYSPWDGRGGWVHGT